MAAAMKDCLTQSISFYAYNGMVVVFLVGATDEHDRRLLEAIGNLLQAHKGWKEAAGDVAK
jgi:hypothetical protein